MAVENAAGFTVGQMVRAVPETHPVNKGGDRWQGRGWSNGAQGVEAALKAGTPLRITRIYRYSVTARLENGGWDNLGTTGTFTNEELLPMDEDWVPPRKLGEKPEGDHLDIDDPRIQWIWDDVGAYATKQRYCAQYDNIADELGIPGRVREFAVSRKLGALTVSGKFKARSKKEAEALLEAELVDG